MEYFLAILPAIVIIFLILVLAYLSQMSLKNKFIKPMEDRIQALEEAGVQKDKTIKQLNDSLLALQVELEHMADDVMLFLKQQPAEPVKEEKPAVKADFYMSTPNRDGSFSMASYSEVFMPSVSIYKFMPIGKDQAEFKIESDEQNLDGLNFLAGKRVEEVNKMAQLGTRLAHTDGGVPNFEIEIEQIDEYNLGELFYMFEIACGISGYMLGVNPFNQPGVEAYKKNMFALLDKPGYEEASKAIRARL